jgi:type II secretory pathway component HofQ
MRTAKLLASLLLMAGAAFVALAPVPARGQDTDPVKQVGLVRTGAGTFSIDVEGADIRTVVRAIAEFSGRNIVVSKDVTGKVRVALKNVGWQEALRPCCARTLDYVEETASYA